MLGFLRARAIDGVEDASGSTYRRTVRHDDALGTIEIAHLPEAASLAATIRVGDVRALPAMVARVRNVFDLDADVATIGAHLARDPLLAPLVAARPGLRAPGGWDGFELAMRAVMGQQVTVEAARRLLGQLARICGSPVAQDGPLAIAFPSPAEVARADLSPLGMPGARKQALHAIAAAALADPRLFEPADTIDDTVARLRTIRGVGDWTAHYIALRAAREPDAFPAADVGLLRGAARRGQRPTPAALTARAETWRPWRTYAAQHLWAADAARAG
jgi:AraC family transcriptional regulator of adaptative response / DNA-3-methyladenine glycosylase II